MFRRLLCLVAGHKPKLRIRFAPMQVTTITPCLRCGSLLTETRAWNGPYPVPRIRLR